MTVDVEINSNIIVDEDIKSDTWTVVKKKKGLKSERRRQKKKYVSSLAPIFEDVSEDDIYYSSGEGDEDEDKSDHSKDKNNNTTGDHKSFNSKSIAVPLSLRPNSGNWKDQSFNALQSGETKSGGAIKKEVPCSISLRLSLLEKEEMLVLRRKDRFNPQSDPCQCKEYENSLPQFLKDFKNRNSVERTLPLLDHYDNLLLYGANSFRTGPISSSIKVTESKNKLLPLNTQKNSNKKENIKEVLLPNLFDSLHFKSNQTVHEPTAPVQTRENSDNSVNSVFKEDKCSKLEMSLQETSRKLQNLFDKMESLRLDSNLYFSKMIECFDY